ncbi:phage holin family protein [Altererythrobacter aurantiacus]|uniref:Phage holin family protein n=2 Tax=Parapontixanthobacter aurantiacus TaxID=1463599 RepID=A0A844Z9F4_9SPHN|nr:phage holin family protein [Parapontixanthobacter aurantiacus]
MLSERETHDFGSSDDPVDATGDYDPVAARRADAEGYDPDPPSLIDDAKALYEDGTAYVQAELAFQKTRAKYAANRSGQIAGYAAGLLAIVHLALIALVIGVLIALIPAVGAWAATGIVVGVLLVLAAITGFALKSKIDRLRNVLADNRPTENLR